MLIHQINIYELILVCPYPRNLQMISETAYSSQTKSIGQNLHVSEHRMDIWIWPLQPIKAKKGQYLVLSPWNALKD